MSTLLAFALVAAGAFVQDPVASPQSSDATALPPGIQLNEPFQGAWIDPDRSRDGCFWCRGDRYKMSFGAAGATFVPLLGWRAERDFPLTFRLAGTSRVEPVRTANGFAFRYPAAEERWELRPDGAEQSFWLTEAPKDGRLTIEVATDLTFTGNDARGLHFAASGPGEVVYGHAVAIEPDGARRDLSTTFAGDAIRIALPADAHYPLLVDPFVSVVGVALNEVADNRNPDVTHDASTGIWCVVMEERLSVLNTDIKMRRFDAVGNAVDTDFLELSGTVADQPAVACSQTGNAFAAVWREASFDIVGRRVGALSPQPTAPFAVFNGIIALGVFANRPDIGGSDSGGFLIAYSVESTVLFPDVMFRILDDTGSLGGQRLLANSIGCVTAKVSDKLPPSNHWVVAYSNQLTGCLSGNIHYAAVNVLGTLEQPPIAVANSPFDDDRHVDVAWNGSQGMIVWDRDAFSHHDVMGQAIERTGLGYSFIGGIRNLSAAEPGVSIGGNQREPVIATDGCRFVYAYKEGSTPNILCATVAITGSSLVFHEGHAAVITTNLPHSDLAIAAAGTGAGIDSHYLVVADERDGLNDFDVMGVFYDGRQAGAMFVTVQTGCHIFVAAEPRLFAAGSSALGESFTLTMSGHQALPFVLASAPQTPTLLCTVLGRQCQQGVRLPQLATTFGPTMTVTIPCAPGLVGLTLAFQGVDLLANGGCGASLFGAAFTVTDTIIATVR